jgi:hypothetical protein
MPQAFWPWQSAARRCRNMRLDHPPWGPVCIPMSGRTRPQKMYKAEPATRLSASCPFTEKQNLIVRPYDISLRRTRRGEGTSRRLGKDDGEQPRAKQHRTGNGDSQKTVRCKFFTHGRPPRLPSRLTNPSVPMIGRPSLCTVKRISCGFRKSESD